MKPLRRRTNKKEKSYSHFILVEKKKDFTKPYLERKQKNLIKYDNKVHKIII